MAGDSVSFRDRWNEPYPLCDQIEIGSPYATMIRTGGICIYNDIDVDGTGGEVVTNVFSYDGPIELIALWGIVTDASDIVTASGVYFDTWDGAASDVITADGADLSADSVDTVFIKNGLLAGTLDVLDAAANVFSESAFNKNFVGGMLNPKSSTTCYVRIRVDTDANTDISLRIFMVYSYRNYGITVAAV